MNNRLDYIGKFKDGAVEKMTEIRAKFVALDEELRMLACNSESVDPAFNRTLALARTHIETASMYAIKSVCLKYEDKNE